MVGQSLCFNCENDFRKGVHFSIILGNGSIINVCESCYHDYLSFKDRCNSTCLSTLSKKQKGIVMQLAITYPVCCTKCHIEESLKEVLLNINP